ncbi:MAG: hypothetical protein NXH75_01745 [Halobacteriovoraceae bacterium]|nr:hypothetical protein [Halobacteriovoraceae bacterium]
MAKIKATKNYLNRLSKIEDFIFEQTGSIEEDMIYLLDAIDNRMVNIEVYPNNSMPSYEIEE